MTPVQQCLALIQGMSDKELAEVIAAAKMRRKAEAEPHLRDWLLDGIKLELDRRGQTYPQLSTNAQIEQLVPTYLVNSAIVRKHLETRLLGQIRYDQLIKLGTIAARALADRMEQITPNRPVNVISMMQSVLIVTEALEASYPSYLENGWLGMVVRRRTAT